MEQLKRILIVVAVAASTQSLAQTYFGMSGGLARNVLAGSEIDHQKKYYNNPMSPRTGPTFSAFLKQEFTPFVYRKFELAYVRRGNVSTSNFLWNLNLEYISIPVRLGYQPINSYNLWETFQFGLEGGVALNIAPGDQTEDLANAYMINNGRVSKGTISGLLGANFEYRLSKRRFLFFNVTWYSDLLPLLRYEAGNATYKAGHRGWLFTIGLMFSRE